VRLLVTGGAGYIGSVVTAQLLGEGHTVTVLDDLSTGHRWAVPEGASFIRANLRDPAELLRAMAGGFDAVIHFAGRALVEESVREPEQYYANNVGGTLNLLNAMRAAAVNVLVFSSTCAVYGEPDEVPITENTATRPVNPYGTSKRTVDEMIGAEARAHGLAAVSLRYFNVAGASGSLGEAHDPETHLIPNVLSAAAGLRSSVQVFGTDYPTPDGTAVRDYIHVEDLARAHVLSLKDARAGEHAIYNLGNGSGFSVLEVIDVARAVTGREIATLDAPRRAGDPPVLIASSEKIRTELGWEPQKPRLDQMIGDAWAWLQAHPKRSAGAV
jgi:UDP-glucose 4-epimerase